MLVSSAVETKTYPCPRPVSANLSVSSTPRFRACTVSTSTGGLIEASRVMERPITSSICSRLRINSSE